MKPSRASVKAFALYYFGKVPSIRNKATLHRQTQRITTVIVDTLSLTNGSLLFDRAVPLIGTADRVIATARQALSGHDSPLAAALKGQAEGVPIRQFSGRSLGALYHHGELFTSAWIGKPTTLAHQAELTDTEREQFLMQARKLASHGSTVYAVARANARQAPTSLKEVHLEIVGLLLFHPQLYHGTEEAVARLREADIDIVYVSRDPEHTVLQFATVSLITNQSTVPFVYRPGKALPTSAVCYAALSDDAYTKVLERFPKESTLIVNGPLPDFWHHLAAFLA